MTVMVKSEDGKAFAILSTDDLRFPEIDEVDRQIVESLARGDRTLARYQKDWGFLKQRYGEDSGDLKGPGW